MIHDQRTFTYKTMGCFHCNGYSRQQLLLLATWIIFSYVRVGSARMTHYGSRTIDDIDEIFEILREKHTFASADGSKWSDAVDTWITSIHDDSLEGVLGDRRQLSLTRESMWNLWHRLRTSTRELVIRKLYPILISEESNSGSWRLHCADAHKLCMEDTNCYWKYANFISSCTEDDMQVMSGFEEGQTPHNVIHEDIENYESRRFRRNPLSHKRQVGSTSSRRKSVKRDVYAVEKRIRKDARLENKHKRKRRRKSIFWMGQHVKFPNHPKLDDVLRYFSLRTRSNRCSSKCVGSLIMLNETIYGTLLAHCDCRAKTMPSEYKTWESPEKSGDVGREYFDNWEKTCLLNQQMAQSCRPRIFNGVPGVAGCTATRIECEKDPHCRDAQMDFLSRCSQVINGLRCTQACRESVERLRNVTEGYDTCVCDGSEGPTCRQIRKRVIELCDTKSGEEDSRKDNLLQEFRPNHTHRNYAPVKNSSLKNSSNIFHSFQSARTHLHNDGRNSAISSYIFSQHIIVILLSHLITSVFNFAAAFR